MININTPSPHLRGGLPHTHAAGTAVAVVVVVVVVAAAPGAASCSRLHDPLAKLRAQLGNFSCKQKQLSHRPELERIEVTSLAAGVAAAATGFAAAASADVVDGAAVADVVAAAALVYPHLHDSFMKLWAQRGKLTRGEKRLGHRPEFERLHVKPFEFFHTALVGTTLGRLHDVARHPPTGKIVGRCADASFC